MLRYSLAIPALVAEDLKPGQSIRRSVSLARGNLWKISFAMVLLTMIGIVVLVLFESPFLVVLGLRRLAAHPSSLWLLVPMNIAGGIGATLTGPLLLLALALLYLDARARKASELQPPATVPPLAPGV